MGNNPVSGVDPTGGFVSGGLPTLPNHTSGNSGGNWGEYPTPCGYDWIDSGLSPFDMWSAKQNGFGSSGGGGGGGDGGGGGSSSASDFSGNDGFGNGFMDASDNTASAEKQFKSDKSFFNAIDIRINTTATATYYKNQEDYEKGENGIVLAIFIIGTGNTNSNNNNNDGKDGPGPGNPIVDACVRMASKILASADVFGVKGKSTLDIRGEISDGTTGFPILYYKFGQHNDTPGDNYDLLDDRLDTHNRKNFIIFFGIQIYGNPIEQTPHRYYNPQTGEWIYR